MATTSEQESSAKVYRVFGRHGEWRRKWAERSSLVSRRALVRGLWLLVLLLACGTVVVALARFWPLLHPPIVERAPLAAACDLLQGPCEVAFVNGGRVRLDVQPRGIPVVHPLDIDVVLSGLPPPDRVELDLAGVDMDMGYNRVALSPVASPGQWVGKGMLPVCVRARMTWEARVLLYTDGGVRSAPFRFDAVRLVAP